MDYQLLDTGTEEGRAMVAAYNRENAEMIKGGQQLYAKIKRNSKYFGQGKKGALFEVFVDGGVLDGYLVQGGPGGQYRLSDVNLYVVHDGHEVRIT